MSDLQTPILSLPYIAAAQAQKHVTHNEALSKLDVLVQLTVRGFEQVSPPVTPTDGTAFALGAGATDAWAGQPDGTIAAYVAGAWIFYAPLQGWLATDALTGEIKIWTGSVWALAQAALPQNVDQLGINATANSVNRLSVNAEATLLNNAGAGHQLKLNKAADTDTASLLFQTGFSGRAEMGTTGNDNFAIKVSPDGSAWSDALSVEAATGAVSFPSGASVPSLMPVVGQWTCTTTADWAGFNGAYGISSGDHAENAGTGAEPALLWSDLGLPLSGGTVLNRWTGQLRASSSDLTSIDIRIFVQYGLPDGSLSSTADLTRDLLWGVDGFAMNGEGFVPIDVDLGGYTVPRNGSLTVYMRAANSPSQTNYVFASTNLDAVAGT